MKKMRFVFLALTISALLGCSPESSAISYPPSNDNSSSIALDHKQVHIPALPAGITQYEEATLFIEDVQVPLLNVKVNNSHFYAYPEPTRIDSAYGRLFMRGRIEFVLTTTYAIDASTKVYPSQFNIVPNHDLAAHKITFTIYEPGVYIIEPNNNSDLAIQLRIFDISEMLTLNQVENLYPNHEIIYFPAGIHTQANSQFIDSNNYINLTSQKVLFIDEGAYVQARVRGINVENVIITGHGIITGAHFSRTNQLVPIDFIQSANLQINNISIIDPAAWSLNLYFVEDSSINNVSIISSRANGDGITIQSGKNILVENVYVRSFDDALVVKNYAYPYGNPDRNTHGSTDNIKFSNAFLWVDLAQALEIGYETAGEHIDDVTFADITVFHAFHKPVISIHNSNYADLHRITYQNITVENLQTGKGDAGSNNELIDIKSTYSTTFGDKAVGPTEVGNIYDLEIKNVLVKRKDNGNNAKITIHGQIDNRIDFFNNLSVIDRVTLSQITVIADNVTSDYAYLNTNEYVHNLEVITGIANGHIIERKYTSTLLDEYVNPIEFI
ncbi:MAG: glycosyl hydrolase family 28 protein [Bacilli bacterium]